MSDLTFKEACALVPVFNDDLPPDDRPFLLLARWGWERRDEDRPLEWRVAQWGEWVRNVEVDSDSEYAFGWFASVTSNPYSDYPCDIQRWEEIPR